MVAMAQDPDIAQPRPLVVNDDRNLALLSAPIAGDSATRETQDIVKRLRNEHIPASFGGVPAQVYVTGEAAGNIDFFAMSNDAAKVVIPFVLGVSFLLLMIVFRSIVVPVKAIILNLLSVGATYGICAMATIQRVHRNWLGRHICSHSLSFGCHDTIACHHLPAG